MENRSYGLISTRGDVMKYRFGKAVWANIIRPHLRGNNIEHVAIGRHSDNTVNITVEVSGKHKRFLELEEAADRRRRGEIVDRD